MILWYIPLLVYLLCVLTQVSNTEAVTHLNKSSLLKSQKDNCNIYQGKWAFDDSYPLYESSGCPFIDPEFDCQKYGRPDRNYLKYSWKPDSCVLPRFDGSDFLKKNKGKKIMFVGDSLSLNQWQSLICMLHSFVPNSKTTISKKGTISYVTFQDYEATIYLYHTTYLVDVVNEKIGRVLDLNSIKGGDTWKSMDVLIFNTWHWWTHKGKSRMWDYIRDGSTVVEDMDRLVAFNKGLNTWARWVDQAVDRSKTKVFFQGISPAHYQAKEWKSKAKNCKDEQRPLPGPTYPAGLPPASMVLNKVLNNISNRVNLLDITTLSQLRKDAHPSAYSGEHPGIDCSHWCLPGLPDTWNQLFYVSLL